MSWLSSMRDKGTSLRSKGTSGRSKKDGSHPALKFLEPDETARWIMPATGGLHPLTLLVLGVGAIAGILLTETLPWLQIMMISTVVFLAVALMSMTRYRLLVINEYEVILLRTRALRTATPVERLGNFDRIHPFQVRGSMWGQIFVGPEKLWVHRRFHHTLVEADQALNDLRISGPAGINPTASPTDSSPTGASGTASGTSGDASGGTPGDTTTSNTATSNTATSNTAAGNTSATNAATRRKRRAAEAASTIHRSNRAKKKVKYAKRGGRR